MVQKIYLLALCIMAFALMQVSSAQSLDGALSLTNLRISPQPVVAGNTVYLSFQLYNSYTNPLSNVNLQIISQNPLINASPTYSYITDTVGTGLFGGVGLGALQYSFTVPNSTPAGEYVVDVVASYEGTEDIGAGYTAQEPGVSTMPIYIYVYGTPSIQVNGNENGEITPGLPFTFDLSAINTGTDSARNVSMQILNSSNFTVIGSDSFNLGIISEGASSGAVAELQSQSNISTGVHYLKIRVTYTSPLGVKYNKTISIAIDVQVGAPDIVASIEGSEPQQLNSGSNQTITVLLQNTGNGEARNVSAKFLGNSYISVSGSADNFFIGTLPAGGSATEEVFIAASRNTNSSSYTIPVALSYYSANYGNKITSFQSLPINVAGTAIYNVTSVEGQLYPGATYVPVTFEIKNVGNQPGQEVYINAQSVYPISFTNPNAYESNIAPGQTVNVTFYASVDSAGNAGQYPVTLYEQWRQPNGALEQQYSGSVGYYAPVQQSSSATSSPLVYIAVIAVIVIAAVIMRRRSEGAKNGESGDEGKKRKS